jgi:hypothetical protein
VSAAGSGAGRAVVVSPSGEPAGPAIWKPRVRRCRIAVWLLNSAREMPVASSNACLTRVDHRAHADAVCPYWFASDAGNAVDHGVGIEVVFRAVEYELHPNLPAANRRSCPDLSDLAVPVGRGWHGHSQ